MAKRHVRREEPLLIFSERLGLSELSKAFIETNELRDDALSVITFLNVNGLLNVSNIRKFLREKDK